MTDTIGSIEGSAADRPLVTHEGHSSPDLWEARARFYERYHESPIPADEQLRNLGLFLNPQSLARILLMHELYSQILTVPGVILELGVRWGQNLALFSNLRGIYEPFNLQRRVIGFDTFAGFPTVHEQDGADASITVGGYAVTRDYEQYLETVLEHHERESPLPQVRKFELVKGDARLTVPDYLQRHPETIVALAYFDLDLYEPTRDCLAAIRPHLAKGSVIAFDELGHPAYPGETTAVREVLGMQSYTLRRSRFNPFTSYLIVE